MSPENFKYFRIGPDGRAYSWPPKAVTVDSTVLLDSLENFAKVRRSSLSNKRLQREFFRTISNRAEYIGMLASLYGFNSPITDYSAVPHFSDKENQEAFNRHQPASGYRPPRNSYDWLRLYAQYIFKHCRPRAIIALSKLPQINQENREVEPESEFKKKLKNESQNIVTYLSFLLVYCDQEMKKALQQSINFAELYGLTPALATEVLRDWRDWIDPKFIGLDREPTKAQVPTVLETPDKNQIASET